MIPVLLQLKNFLSYGEDVPALDFTEFDVACLTGENGHGKSAILDAMTWALWGEARKAVGEKSPADGLLRIGTTAMQVEFVFDLEADRYRVLRKYHRKKGKRGTPSLEFQLWDPASNAYKPLSEKSNTQTQEKINATLRMTYETFINSAFILQGHVDEFTKRNPSQRKAILAEILDLSRYEALRELTRAHLRQSEREQAAAQQKLDTMAEELQHATAHQSALDELQPKLARTNDQLRAAETEQHALLERRAELQGLQQHLTDKQRQHARLQHEADQTQQRIRRQEQQLAANAAILDRETDILAQHQRYGQLQDQNAAQEGQQRDHARYLAECAPLERAIADARHALEKERETWRAERAQAQRLIDETRRLLDQAADIERGYQELCAGRQQDDQWESQRLRAEELGRSMRDVEAEIAAETNRLNVELHTLHRHIRDLRALADQLPEHERRRASLSADVAEMERLEQTLEQQKEEGAQCRAALDSVKTRRERNLGEEHEILERIDLLKRSRQPQCPLCQAALDERKKHDIAAHFQQQLAALTQERRQLDQELTERDARLTQLRATYKQLEHRRQQGANLRQQLVQAEHAARAGQQADEQLRALQPQADALAATLANRAYARDAHGRLETLRRQQLALQYDAAAHQALRKRLKTWQHFDGAYSKLEDTRLRHDNAVARLPESDRRIADIQARLDQQQYARAEHEAFADVQARIQALGYAADEHERIRRELQQLQHVPTAKAQLEQARKAARELERTQAELLEERQRKTEQLAELQRNLTEAQQRLEQLPPLEQRIRAQEQALKALRAERDDLLQRQAAARSKLDHCLNVEAQQRLEQQRKTQIDKDCRLYEHLYKMFGKDGIQAYLIENAIPDIEEEANAILARLTDNRTSIAIESVKDSHSGGIRETLDIKISDELGTRSYEMYSGGEAFRVDFSIRVALSKLLATRAGTRLKTLVIDEGFGTQDARGLEQLVQAITEISRDFEKILVVTHVEALKDAFPVKIEVVKFPDIGSQYQVIH